MGRDPSWARHRGWHAAFFGVLLSVDLVLLGYGNGNGTGFSLGLAVVGLTALIGLRLVVGLVVHWASRRVADGLTGFRTPLAIPPADTASSVFAAVGAGASGPGLPRAFSDVVGRPRPVDWPGLVESMAIRIEDALGPGFFAHGFDCTLFLSHADSTRRIDVSPIVHGHLIDPTQAAIQACTRMLDAGQMFKMQQLRQPWPRRPLQDDSSPPVTLARPEVVLRDVELHMRYEDELGTVLELPSLPFVEGHPEPDGPIRLA